jgi:putative phosphoribosyl transferase
MATTLCQPLAQRDVTETLGETRARGDAEVEVTMQFHDREEAGRFLAEACMKFAEEPLVVLALPRGGVPVAAPVAQALQAPLDVVVACKVGHPRQPEYAIAAVGEGGELVSNPREVARVDPDAWGLALAASQREAALRRHRYCGTRAALDLHGKMALLVDDGVATGLTMRVAVREAYARGAARVVVAVPVAAADSARTLRSEADGLVTLLEPAVFAGAVAAYYQVFEPVPDETVMVLLDRFSAE